jgi:hypothetical protein
MIMYSNWDAFDAGYLNQAQHVGRSGRAYNIYTAWYAYTYITRREASAGCSTTQHRAHKTICQFFEAGFDNHNIDIFIPEQNQLWQRASLMNDWYT